ncbi:hypothetical protein SEPCBS57363_004887 [Sporothrix epigloea]|uniref:FAD dependent oxidoreductase domain-containing protein n=1 Tax=Sporothrix epigloea TaxID=1892477 RepID=A0ABP0DUN1_9PEZI
MPAQVAVIGAGITGLTVALRLVEETPKDSISVTIVARDFPAPAETFFLDPAAHINYTSPWGGAHYRSGPWVPDGSEAAAVAERYHKYALATYRHMQAYQAKFPEAGITFMPGIEYLEKPGPEYTRLQDMAAQEQLGLHEADLNLGFRILDSKTDGFPDGVTWGCMYRTWCVNPMVYCQFLLRRFVAAGGRIAKRDLRAPQELLVKGPGAEFALVVNCSGYGFGDDPNMFITRGQTCLVRNKCDASVTRQNADGSWTFSVPRNFDGGTIIGGTKEPDDWDAEPSMQTRERLLSKFAATYPKILADSKDGKFDVLSDVVGRRPTRRGGMRLEVETVAVAGRAETDKKPVIVHAYGVGGSGYEISWGVAGDVVELVKKNL